MKLNELINKLQKFGEDHPELMDKEVYVWDEYNESYVGLNNFQKFRNKGYIEKDIHSNSLSEEDVCYSVKDFNDLYSTKYKKDDLQTIVLL